MRLIQDQDYYQQQQQLKSQSKAILSEDIYEALKMATTVENIAEAKQLLGTIASQLQATVQANPATVNLRGHMLTKLSQLLNYLDANGNYKFALDEALLEIRK